MFINLNSIDEPNPRNFKNSLSNNIVIKPDSYICLHGATITRNNHIQKIVLENNALLQVKLMPYDIAEFSLAAGTYTVDEFCALINANFTKFNGNVDRYGDVCALRSMNAIKTGTLEDKTITFEFRALGNNTNEYGIIDVLGIDKRFAFNKVQSILGKNNPNIRPGTIGNTAASLIGGNNASYACANMVATETTPYNPYGYTPPPNQANNLALNMGATPFDYLSNYFYIAQPNLRNIKFLVGKALYDDANNRYTSAATFGGGGWSDPNGEVNNCPFYISFKDTGLYDFYVLNKNTGSFDVIAANQAYQPGDLINFTAAESTNAILIGDGRIRAPFLSHLQGNGLGLLYFMNLDVGGVPVRWNSTNSKVLDLSEYINGELFTIRDQNWTAYKTFWDAGGHNSYARPIGARIGTGVQAEGTYVDCNNNGGFLWRQNSDQPVSLIDLQTGNANPRLNGTPFFRRYSAGAAPAVSPDVRSHLLMSPSTDGILLKNFPYMISFYFRLVDDTAKLPGGSIDQHTFISDINGQTILSVIPANASAHDVEVRYSGGTVQNFTLLEVATSARINIAYGTDYFMSMIYKGTAHGQMEIAITDLNANLTYLHQQATVNQIENVGSISCSENDPVSGTNYAKSFNGYFGHLRIHTQCQTATFPLDGFDNIYTNVVNYIKDGTISGDVWYGYREAIQGNNNPQYLVLGNINSSRTLTPVFDKDTLSIPIDNTWGDFINPYFRHAYYVRNDRRITNLDVEDYQGDVFGLLNVSNLNTGSGDTFTFPDEDARNNVVKAPEQIQVDELLNPNDPIVADVAKVELEDKTVYVEIPNLPHRSYNAVTGSNDKTIGVIPVNGVNCDRVERDNLNIISAYPPTKNWIALNNPGEIPLNQLHVKLIDVRGKELDASEIVQETSVSIEIKSRSEIF